MMSTTTWSQKNNPIQIDQSKLMLPNPALAIYGKSNMDLIMGSESYLSAAVKVERQELPM
jgi:hypothetical protein